MASNTSSGSDHGKQLALAVRRNRGKQLQKAFLHDVALALKRTTGSIQTLPLEESDELRRRMEFERESRPNADKAIFRRSWPADRLRDVERIIDRLKVRLPERRIYLFRALSDYLGAVETTSTEVLTSAFALIDIDQEDLWVASADGLEGMLLSWSTDWTRQDPWRSTTWTFGELSGWRRLRATNRNRRAMCHPATPTQPDIRRSPPSQTRWL